MKDGKRRYDTALFDSSKFDLDGVYPRPSIVRPAGLLSRQPFTALYLSFVIPFLLLVVPIAGALKWTYLRLFVNDAPPWSMPDFIAIYLVRVTILVWWMPTHGGIRGLFHAGLTDSQRTWRSRWMGKGAMPDQIKPFPHSRVVGPMQDWLKETGSTELTGTVPIWWVGERSKHLIQPEARQGERLLVYLAGGGYMISCHPATPLGQIPATMQKAFSNYVGKNAEAAAKLPQSVVTVEYRKSGQSPTPSALIDCLALYKYVTEELSFDPTNITLMGDSAGGHLVNTVIRYLQDARLPVPDSAILICVSFITAQRKDRDLPGLTKGDANLRSRGTTRRGP